HVSLAVVCDCEPAAHAIDSGSAHGRPIAVNVVNGHIVIAKKFVKPPENSIEIKFKAGDASLNRSPEFMYALFVPARAHLAFPCFDQPNLKARFTLELTVPADWETLSNAADTLRDKTGETVRSRYGETQPTPTYLF